jgi:hypothetical protein
MKRKRLLVTIIAIAGIVGIAIMYLLLRGPSRPSTHDVAGVDIPDVPRYLGSIRYNTGTYYTSDNVNTVANWYETEVPSYGWENISITPWEEGAFEGDLKLTASIDSKSLFMTIARSSVYEGYTIIGIGITPYT